MFMPLAPLHEYDPRFSDPLLIQGVGLVYLSANPPVCPMWGLYGGSAVTLLVWGLLSLTSDVIPGMARR